ncbi:hypothetical protein [Methylorubrum extorquens]|uniref:hypothetical protein n=1 Tax=Methylorubrum extorquens TaxID=408 RepID=UPI00138A0CC9|nr:hypothetical protein [Methylorubrum extorquens]
MPVMIDDAEAELGMEAESPVFRPIDATGNDEQLLPQVGVMIANLKHSQMHGDPQCRPGSHRATSLPTMRE